MLYDSGHYKEAAGEMERSLGIDASQVEAWLNLAQARGKLRRMGDALDAINNAIRINPLDAQVNVYFCGYRTRIGRIDTAESHARRATQLDPALALGWFNLAWRCKRRNVPPMPARPLDVR